MPNINIVDYIFMSVQAGVIRGIAASLNSEVDKIYDEMESLNSSWKGKRYNALITEFNNLIPELDKVKDLVENQLPFTLETVSNNYSQADTGSNIKAAISSAIKRTKTIPVKDEVGMKFITSDVEGVQQKVDEHFNNVLEKIDEIKDTFSKINWESEAATEFNGKLSTIRTNLTNSFENIRSQFKKSMEQTKEDIKNAETANTVQ